MKISITDNFNTTYEVQIVADYNIKMTFSLSYAELLKFAKMFSDFAPVQDESEKIKALEVKYNLLQDLNVANLRDSRKFERENIALVKENETLKKDNQIILEAMRGLSNIDAVKSLSK